MVVVGAEWVKGHRDGTKTCHSRVRTRPLYMGPIGGFNASIISLIYFFPSVSTKHLGFSVILKIHLQNPSMYAE